MSRLNSLKNNRNNNPDRL